MSKRVIALAGVVLIAGLIAGCLPDREQAEETPDTGMGTPIPAPDTSERADTGSPASNDAGHRDATADTGGSTPGDTTAETGVRDAGDAGIDTDANPTDASDAPTSDTLPDTHDGTRRDTSDGAADTGTPRDTHTPDTSTRDTFVGADTSDAETTDAGTPDATADTSRSCSVTCGTNAHCSGASCVCDAGYVGDPTSSCYQSKSCQSRSDCGAFTLCVGGECTCVPGFERRDGKSCTRPTVGAPANRTKSRVCDRWTSRTQNLTSNLWAQRPNRQCDLGELKPVVQWEAMEATNIYRWLIGLDPLQARQSYIDTNQHCATCLAAEGRLTHTPSSSFACYTKDAADGAGSSNIAYGLSHPAETVRQYIRDKHVPKLGHRRWIFSPGVGATGFGHRGNYGCMWALDNSGTDPQRDMYYPAPGPFPEAALTGPWSYFSADKLDTANASISVTAVATGTAMQVSNVTRLTHGTYGRVTGVSWEVPNATTGTEYRVTISGLGSSGSTTKSYKTTLVTCP